MQAARLKPFLVFGLSLITSVPARAQPLIPQTESIESMVANADLVFVAKLVDFRAREPGDERHGHDVTIAIDETLKQDVMLEEPYTKLSLDLPHPAPVLEDWKARKSPLLVAYDEYAPQQTTAIELSRDKLEVMTADFKLLRDPKAVIQAAREAARRLPVGVKRVHTFKLAVPRKLVAETQWDQYYDTGGHLLLSVPVDKQLEKRAHDYLRSEDPHRRAEGAQALAYFKSDENIARVRPLLDDAEPTYVQPAYDDKGEQRVYGVRYAAYRTLTSWGIDVEKPVIREEAKE